MVFSVSGCLLGLKVSLKEAWGGVGVGTVQWECLLKGKEGLWGNMRMNIW